MKFNRIRFFLCLALGISAVLPSIAFGDSVLSCENKGGYETNCFLSKLYLAAKIDIERSFSIEYSMPCIGHEINIGVLDESGKVFWPLKQSKTVEKFTVVSYGPLTTYDPDRNWTASADFQVGCQLNIKIVESDLSDTEKKRLNLVIDTIRLQGDLVDQVLHLASNVTLLKNIIAQLDVSSIADILAEKYVDTKSLADSYENQGKRETADALRSVQDDLRLGICLNLALAERHQDICGDSTKPIPKETDGDVKQTITQKANAAMSNLETTSALIVKTTVDATTDLVSTFATLIAYSSFSSAAEATTKVCPTLKKLNIKTSACK